MTKLANLIARRIAVQGPISIADYMAECLLHPDHGYYTNRDPLGADGDFTTAPEISQMFGELIGLSLAQAWLDQGAPADVALVELGPGRGTLMADALRATATVPGFHAALRVHFIEASPVLRAAQARAVPNAVWHDDLGSLPDVPVFVIANEFFDALPIKQFVRVGDGWSERRVGGDGALLQFGLAAPAPFAQLAHRLPDTKDGDMVELCPAAAQITAQIGAHIASHGGAAIIVDYGDWASQGDTLQALRAHAPCDPLTDPGLADLTAHVDFAEISRAVPEGAKFSRVALQGVFLERLGITPRAQQLAAGLTGDRLDDLIAAHRRLTHPDEMGRLFKVIGIYPAGHTPPAGLEP